MERKLYELTADLQTAFDALWLDDDGVMHGFEELEAVTADWEAKAEATALYIKQLKSDAEAIKAEEAALYDRRKRKERKAESLIGYLGEQIIGAGRDRFETTRCDCRFRKTQKVLIQDESLLPESYIREKVVREPDKTAIKDAIKHGEEVPGAYISEERKLNIK